MLSSPKTVLQLYKENAYPLTPKRCSAATWSQISWLTNPASGKMVLMTMSKRICLNL